MRLHDAISLCRENAVASTDSLLSRFDCGFDSTCRASHRRPRPIKGANTKITMPLFSQPFIAPAPTESVETTLRGGEYSAEGLNGRIKKTIQREITDHRSHMVELDRTVGLIVRTAGGLFLTCVAVVRPGNNSERRRSCSPDMALETTSFAADYNGMRGASMRFRPPVKNGVVPALINMPMVQGTLCAPAARRCDDQTGLIQKDGICSDQFMEAASAAFYMEVRKIGLQSVGQSFGLVPADR